MIPGIYSSEKNILELCWEAWWPQPLQGCQWRGQTGKLVTAGAVFWPLRVKSCWVQSELWETRDLDLFPPWSFPIRTSCGALQHLQSSGLFVLQEVSELAGPTWVLKGGVFVLEAVSFPFSMITCTSPLMCGWLMGHRKGWAVLGWWCDSHHPSSSVSSGPAVFGSNSN